MANRFILIQASALENNQVSSLSISKADSKYTLNDCLVANNSSPLNYHL